ncbi:MAG: N-acetyltransferase [Xanthomonadaceae bacterium]|nr:N-acetyltransferase [Xanthomonadaceae bacterium]
MSKNEALFSIRPAELRDAEAIVEIYNQSVLETTATFDIEPRSLSKQTELLTNRSPKHPVFVAEQEGRVVAWASVGSWSDRAGYRFSGETSVYVDKNHWGKGIGKRLMHELVSTAQSQGLHTLLARISTENLSSIRIHETFGFKEAALLKEVGFKFERYIDVVILQKLL